MSNAPIRLADLTTLRVGGPAARFVEVSTDDALVEEVRRADTEGTPLLVLGDGSNLVVSDDGFPGTVVRIATTGIETDGDIVRAAAGEEWDAFVARMVGESRVGVETLAGIPGRIGATPVQNVGAYGADVAQTIVQVLAYDRGAGRAVSMSNAECGFTYRHSIFKGSGRYVVLAVHFTLPVATTSAPVRYAELARALGVDLGASAPIADVREAVLVLRRTKGMVLDADDPDTWSAGSFFTNPIVAGADVPDGAPRFPSHDGVKTSAAWLIEQAGFPKGYGAGAARLSTKHTLALTNRGGATAADILDLAREIRDGVEARFGIRLAAEPLIVGSTL